MIWQLIFNPTVLVEAAARRIPPATARAHADSTTAWQPSIATLLAIPAALVLGRGRGSCRELLWLILPVSLLLPSLRLRMAGRNGFA